MNYVQYMEIYDKTHIKFADSKEENKIKKKKKKDKKKKRKAKLRIRVFAFSFTHPNWKNYHSKTVGSLIKHGVIYSSFHD